MVQHRIRRSRLVIAFAVGVFFLIAVAACTGPTRKEQPPGDANTARVPQEPIIIGLLAPFSGPFASSGKNMVDGINLALAEANESGGVSGRPIKLVTGDSQGTADQARTQALQLIEQKKVTALIGAYLSEETLEVIEVAAERQVPLIVPVSASNEINARVAGDPDRYQHVFRVAYNITQWAQMMGDFLIDQGAANYAFVGANIRWNQEFSVELEDYLQAHDIKPVFQEFYSARQPVFEPILQFVQDTRPEILVLGDPGQNAVELVKRIRQAGLETPLFSVGGAMGDHRAAEAIEPLGELFFQAAAWERSGTPSATFFETFRQANGYSPMGYADVLSHDAAAVLIAAMRSAGSADSDPVAEALATGKFVGLAGEYAFDLGHQAGWQAGGRLGGAVVGWTEDGGQVVWPR